MNDLVNRGVIVLGGSPAEGDHDATLIVTGVARGGTSMIAQVLDRMGVFLGDRRDAVVCEDTEILTALQRQDKAALDKIVSNRNERMRKWGFKIPNLHTFLVAADEQRFRKPRFIIIFRDPLAIAKRNELSVRQRPTRALEQAGENVRNLTRYACALESPALLLSYEKAIQNPAGMIKEVADFGGLSPTEGQLSKALAAVQVNGATYIAATQANVFSKQDKYKGSIDGVRDDILVGWCSHSDTDAPVELEVLVNNRPFAHILANSYRKDLEDANIFQGRHGFFVSLPDAFTSTTIIDVRPRGRDLPLKNSGSTVSELRSRLSQPGGNK